MIRLPWVTRRKLDRVIGRCAAQASARVARARAETAKYQRLFDDAVVDLAIARHGLHEADTAGCDLVPGEAAAFARRHEALADQLRQKDAEIGRLQARLAAQVAGDRAGAR